MTGVVAAPNSGVLTVHITCVKGNLITEKNVEVPCIFVSYKVPIMILLHNLKGAM
jgi:hypothetical protein